MRDGKNTRLRFQGGLDGISTTISVRISVFVRMRAVKRGKTMPDIDKVINGLERCLVCNTSIIGTKEGQRAYIDCEYTIGLYCGQDRVIRESIVLLKEYKQLGVLGG